MGRSFEDAGTVMDWANLQKESPPLPSNVQKISTKHAGTVIYKLVFAKKDVEFYPGCVLWFVKSTFSYIALR